MDEQTKPEELTDQETTQIVGGKTAPPKPPKPECAPGWDPDGPPAKD